jgi:hypothetical protein
MICHDCKEEITKSGNGDTGYGTVFKTGKKICYACCALRDIEQMKESDRISLYLCDDTRPWRVTNWPGTLSIFATGYVTPHGHSWGLTRRDVWFVDTNGAHWHGVQYGDNTQLVHCKKLKHPVEGLELCLPRKA